MAFFTYINKYNYLKKIYIYIFMAFLMFFIYAHNQHYKCSNYQLEQVNNVIFYMFYERKTMIHNQINIIFKRAFLFYFMQINITENK